MPVWCAPLSVDGAACRAFRAVVRGVQRARHRYGLESTDVDWPNAIDGGRLHGHEAVRAYWARQFIAVSPTVHPTNVVLDDNGKVVVTVHQVVQDLSGSVLKDQYVRHIYELRGEMIARMDIRSDIE